MNDQPKPSYRSLILKVDIYATINVIFAFIKEAEGVGAAMTNKDPVLEIFPSQTNMNKKVTNSN